MRRTSASCPLNSEYDLPNSGCIYVAMLEYFERKSGLSAETGRLGAIIAVIMEGVARIAEFSNFTL